VSYRIEWDPSAEEHLACLTARDQSAVIDTVERQLAHQPTVATRNRKRMRPNPLATWELRVGRARVYYEVVEEPARIVSIRAVGVKDRSRVLVGSEEIRLS
jgi:mRNA-degrading endonuclease RelE of RelBE toxin-antitoxin system